MTARTPQQIADQWFEAARPYEAVSKDLATMLTKWRDETVQETLEKAANVAEIEAIKVTLSLGKSAQIHRAILAIGKPRFREGELVRGRSGAIYVWPIDVKDESVFEPVHVEIIDGRAIVREEADRG